MHVLVLQQLIGRNKKVTTLYYRETILIHLCCWHFVLVSIFLLPNFLDEQQCAFWLTNGTQSIFYRQCNGIFTAFTFYRYYRSAWRNEFSLYLLWRTAQRIKFVWNSDGNIGAKIPLRQRPNNKATDREVQSDYFFLLLRCVNNISWQSFEIISKEKIKWTMSCEIVADSYYYNDTRHRTKFPHNR